MKKNYFFEIIFIFFSLSIFLALAVFVSAAKNPFESKKSWQCINETCRLTTIKGWKGCDDGSGKGVQKECQINTKYVCNRKKCEPGKIGKRCDVGGKPNEKLCAVEEGKCGGPFVSAENPPPVNKLCSSSGGSTEHSSANPTFWSWYCNGVGGGKRAFCTAPKIRIDGECGGPFEQPLESRPSEEDACNFGNFAIDPETEKSPTEWTWNCTGKGAGKTAFCTAPKKKIDAKCGFDNGKNIASQPPSEGKNLCDKGTPQLVEGKPAVIKNYDGSWGWLCYGVGGGEDVRCKTAAPAPESGEMGRCGSSDRKFFRYAPESNLCSPGTVAPGKNGVQRLEGTDLWKWWCNGTGKYANTTEVGNCYAYAVECGSLINEKFTWEQTPAITARYCANKGQNGPATFNYKKQYWEWTCLSSDGPPLSCHTKPVFAACGELSGRNDLTQKPSIYDPDLCGEGSVLDGAISGDANGPVWYWTCKMGSDKSSCQASKKSETCDASQACNYHGICPAGSIKTSSSVSVNVFNGFIGGLLNSYLSKISNKLFAVESTCSCEAGKCECASGYDVKTNCETKVCTSFTYNYGPCQPSGVQLLTVKEKFPAGCTNGSPKTSQQCTPSQNPETNPCGNINCGEHGNCVNGSCECTDNYTGPVCEYPPGEGTPQQCTRAYCNNKGNCSYENGAPVCTCDGAGWDPEFNCSQCKPKRSGSNCEINSAAVNGACGPDTYSYGSTTLTQCASGTPVPAGITMPAPGTWTDLWRCEGLNGGTTDYNCKATQEMAPMWYYDFSLQICTQTVPNGMSNGPFTEEACYDYANTWYCNWNNYSCVKGPGNIYSSLQACQADCHQ